MNHQSITAWMPWHVYVLAAVLGLFAPEAPTAAACCAALAWFAGRGLGQRRVRAALVAGCFLVGAVAGWAAAPAEFDPPDWMLAREKVRFTGRVASAAGSVDRRLQVILEDVRVERPSGAEVLPYSVVWTWDQPALRPRPGDLASMSNRLKPVRDFGNPGSGGFEGYWKRQGVGYRAYTRGATRGLSITPGSAPWWWTLREGLRDRLMAALPRNQGGAMVMALLLGDRFFVDHEVSDLMRSAGLAHTMALSGLHLGYMAGLGLALAWLAGAVWPKFYLRAPRRKLAVALAVPLAVVYLWLGQATPSLLRASLMLGVMAVLLLRDRDRVLLDGLFIAVGIILAANPLAVYDLRLQLSALAVLGIAVFLRPLLGAFPRWPGPFGRCAVGAWAVLAVSLAANIGVLPVSASVFGEASPNLWVNVLWLPALGFVVLPLAFAGLGLVAISWTAEAGGWLLTASASCMQWMLDALAWLDRTVLLQPVSLLRPLWPEMAGYALAMCVLAASLRNPPRRWFAGLGLALALVAGPHFFQAYDAAHQGVALNLLDVGQGQSAVVDLPWGGRVLVDAGGFHSERFDAGRSVVGPWLAHGLPPVLDAAILSHPDLDHSRGLPFLVDRFRVGRVLFNGDWPVGRDRVRLELALNRSRTPIIEVGAGSDLDLGDGVVLEVLHPAADFQSRDTNARSLVLRLVWRGRGLALLPGDIERRGIRALLASGRDLRAEVLALPHHGSKGSASALLYRAVSPEAALCSAGYLNQFEFPNPKVRNLLAAQGIPLRVTGEDGLLRCRWPTPLAEPIFEAGLAGASTD